MDLLEIRKTIITAVASDDVLVERLVLKGGNALEIVHRIGGRASLDLDFSMEGDFDNPEEIGRRLHRSLSDRFDSVGFEVFDYRFAPRPSAARSNTTNAPANPASNRQYCGAMSSMGRTTITAAAWSGTARACRPHSG